MIQYNWIIDTGGLINADYKIKLTGPGIRLEKSVSEPVAQKVLLTVLGPARSASGLSAGPQAPASPEEEMSARGALARCGARRIPEKIAALAYHLMERGKDKWDRQDLTDAFEEAKEPIPGNLVRDITWTIKIGWIAPKPGDGSHFYLTAAGISAVETKFPDELRRKTKVSFGGRKRKP